MSRAVHRAPALVAGALGSLLLAAPTRAQQVAVTGTAQFATGEYVFAESIDSVFVVAGLDVAAGPVRASVSIPFSWQSQPWLVPGAHVVIPSGGPQYAAVGRGLQGRGRGGPQDDPVPVVLPSEETTGWTSGAGDPMARVDVTVLRLTTRRPAVSLAGGFKVPLASVDSGLGTGKWDYGGGLSVAQPVAGVLVMADLFYWKLGDLPDLELQDTLAYSIGVGKVIGGGRLSVMGSFLGSTVILEGSTPARSVSLAVSYLSAPGRSLTAGASVGLSETAPACSLWLGWRLAL